VASAPAATFPTRDFFDLLPIARTSRNGLYVD
jgi:hypothetical protein